MPFPLFLPLVLYSIHHCYTFQMPTGNSGHDPLPDQVLALAPLPNVPPRPNLAPIGNTGIMAYTYPTYCYTMDFNDHIYLKWISAPAPATQSLDNCANACKEDSNCNAMNYQPGTEGHRLSGILVPVTAVCELLRQGISDIPSTTTHDPRIFRNNGGSCGHHRIVRQNGH